MLALVGAVVAPYFIDWTAYRDDFQREASRILGRPVVVRGEASARLLPFPSVTFGDVEVLGADAAPLLTIDRFRMDAELAPYLSGEILIYSMTLDRPVLRVPIARDGAIGLVVERPAIPAGARVVLENVVVNDGAIAIDNAMTARRYDLTGVTATLSADSLAGPFSGSGTLTAGGAPVAFTLSSGVEQPDGSLPLRIETDNPRFDAGLAIDGKVAVEGGRPRFTGTAQLVRPLPKPAVSGDAAADPFALADTATAPDADETAAQAEDSPPVLPIRATGALNLTVDAADLTDVRVQAGDGKQPYILTGKGNLGLGAVPRFALTLTGEQVDVDALAGAPARSPDQAVPSTQTPADPAAGPALDLASRIEAVRRVLADVPRPTIPGSIAISLPVVTAGDTTIRDVAFSAGPTEDGWKVDGLKAELPGRTTLQASGRVTLADRFGFKGDLLVASAQPSGFSDWLSGAIDPAVRALSRAGFSAKAEIAPGRQVFDDLEIDIGGDSLNGRLERTEANGAASLSTALTGKAIDLDALLALSRLFTGTRGTIAQADSFDLSLAAGPVTLRDARADRVDADMSFDGGRLQIDKLAVDGLAGASFDASGSLSDVVGDARGQLQLSLSAAEPQAFLAFLSNRYPGIPILELIGARAGHLAPLSLSGEMRTLDAETDGAGGGTTAAGSTGSAPTLYVRLDGTANGSKIDLATSIENGFSALSKSGRFGLDLRLENDRPTVLLGQLGLSAIDLGAPSPLEAELSLSAGVTGPIVTTASLRAPGSELSVDGTVSVTPGGITGADLSLYASSDDAAPWLSTAAVDLGQPLDGLPVSLSGEAAYDGGNWKLDGLTGTIDGVDVAATLEKPAGAPVTGSLHLAELSMPWLSGLVYGSAYGTVEDGAAGKPWPTTAFTATRLPPLSYSLAFDSDRVDFGGIALGNVSAQLSGSPEGLIFDAAGGTVPGGSVEGRLALRNAGGVGGVTLEADTDALDLSAYWPALARPDTEASLDGTIRLDGTGQSYAALLAGLTGAGSLAVENAVVPGIAPDLLAPLLAAADTQGFSADTGTADAVRRLSSGKTFDLPAIESAFAVTAGTARFAPATAKVGNETLTLGGTLDLAGLAVAGDLALAIDPGDDRVEGAEPLVGYALSGPLRAPTLTPDVDALSNYLSVRALEREQARVEALQENLQETLRLRREARFYRWRAGEAERVAEARLEAEAAERRRAAEAEAAERAKIAAEEAAAREKAQDDAADAAAAAVRQRQEAAAARRQEQLRAAEATRRQREANGAGQRVPSARPPASSPAPTPAPAAPDTGGPAGAGIDFGSAGVPVPRDPPVTYPSLPGVLNPLEVPAAPGSG